MLRFKRKFFNNKMWVNMGIFNILLTNVDIKNLTKANIKNLTNANIKNLPKPDIKK